MQSTATRLIPITQEIHRAGDIFTLKNDTAPNILVNMTLMLLTLMPTYDTLTYAEDKETGDTNTPAIK